MAAKNLIAPQVNEISTILYEREMESTKKEPRDIKGANGHINVDALLKVITIILS